MWGDKRKVSGGNKCQIEQELIAEQRGVRTVVAMPLPNSLVLAFFSNTVIT